MKERSWMSQLLERSAHIEKIEKLEAELAEANEEIASLKEIIKCADIQKEKEWQHFSEELETERLRLAACGVAALGYFEGCKDEYRSASLEDTLRLYESYKEATRQRDEAMQDAEKWRNYQKRKQEVIDAGMGRKILRDAMLDDGGSRAGARNDLR